MVFYAKVILISNMELKMIKTWQKKVEKYFRNLSRRFLPSVSSEIDAELGGKSGQAALLENLPPR